MAAQKGKLLLLKVGNGASPEVFTTVGGMKTNSVTKNNQMVEITNKGSAGWRELLEGAGIANLSISGSGVFTDGTAEETVRAKAFADTISNYRLEFGNGDYLIGSFQITSYERSGAHDDAEQFSLSLESAGAVTFTTV